MSLRSVSRGRRRLPARRLPRASGRRIAVATIGLVALVGSSLTGTLASASPPANSTTTWITSLKPSHVSSHWGPYERNLSAGKKPAGDGKTLTVNGKRYKHGLGVHARSVMSYKLTHRYNTFQSRIGVDDEVGNRGSVVFKVFVDGKKRYTSPVLRGSHGSRAVSVNIAGAKTLTLIVTNANASDGKGSFSDHADWVRTRLITRNSSTPPPTTPAPSGAFPGAGNTGVPAGTALSSTGNLTISSPGVVEGKDVKGTVNINASNVTFRNSRVTGSSFSIIRIKDGATGVRIEHVTLNGLGNSGTSNSMGVMGPATVVACDISGTENGVTPGSGSVIQDNWIHDLGAPGAPHLDGIQMDGGLSNIQVLHNTIDGGDVNGSVSAVMADNYFGSISNIKVDGNRLSGGQYTVYSDGTFNSNSISGLSFTNNRMTKGNYGYGLVRGTGSSGVVWSGNVNDATGAAVRAS